jgi:hypothetical protein
MEVREHIQERWMLTVLLREKGRDTTTYNYLKLTGFINANFKQSKSRDTLE